MSGAEISNLRARWSSGALVIEDSAGNAILTINPSSGGIAIANSGPLTVSTGFVIDNWAVRTVTTDATLVQADKGKVVKCSVDAVFITLPVASTTTLPGGTFTVMNTATAGGAGIILITNTGDSILGAGVSTSNLLANTKATAQVGDYVTVIATGSSSWYVAGMAGTWASTS